MNTQAIQDVLAERKRQIEAEGFTLDHDDKHVYGELAKAATCYAYHAAWPMSSQFGEPSHLWPWRKQPGSWKPARSDRGNAVKAAALLIAEIERIDRASSTTGSR